MANLPRLVHADDLRGKGTMASTDDFQVTEVHVMQHNGHDHCHWD